MESIIYLLLGFVLGFVIGNKLTQFWQNMVFHQILKDLGVKDQDLKRLAEQAQRDLAEDSAPTEDAELATMEVRIEEHQGQLYAYTVKEDRFLGQGEDRDALIERLKQNLNNVRLIISDENGAEHVRQTS